MVAGYFAQRASKENQTTVLRVLKEIGTDAVLENATLGKAVKAKYGLPHKGCGKVSKFLMWAGVPKKVVDSFYYVIKDLNNDPSQVQVIHRSLGYDAQIMTKQSDSLHFSSCMKPRSVYYDDNIDEDIEAFDRGLVGLVVLGDINDRTRLFSRAKYRFLFNPDTLKEDEPYEPQAVAILLDRNYPNHNAAASFVTALNQQYPHLPIVTLKGRVSPSDRRSRFSTGYIFFSTQEALNLVMCNELVGFPNGEVLGYQDTLDEGDGGISVDDLVALTKAETNDVVSKFQKEAYLRKRAYFINHTPIKGGMSYIYELFPSKSLNLIEKENEQVFIHFEHFSTKTSDRYSRWNHVYQMRQLRQSALKKVLQFTNVFERTCFDIFNYFDGGSEDLNRSYDYLVYAPKGTFLTLLGLQQLIKSHKSLRRLFKWLPMYISTLVLKTLNNHPHLKQRLEEISMLPLPTSIRLYLNAFAIKTRREDPYRWVDTIIKELPEAYEYDAFLAQDKQSGFLVVYENHSHELEKAVLVSSFFQNDKQKEALQDALSVYKLYEDFASLFNEELNGSTVQYFNWRTQ